MNNEKKTSDKSLALAEAEEAVLRSESLLQDDDSKSDTKAGKQDSEKKESGKEGSEKVESKQDDSKKVDQDKSENKKDDHGKDQESKKDHAKKDDHKNEDHGDDDHSKDGHDKDGHDKDGHDKDGHAHKTREDLTMGEQLQVNMDYHLGTEHLFAHVKDSDVIHLPFKQDLKLPKFFKEEKQSIATIGNFEIKGNPSKFMALELVAAIFLVGLFTTLAGKIRGGARAKGRFWNCLEVFIVFVRDEIARPAIGSKDANKFLPFLLTTFFFILALNLLGMIPSLGSATGSIAVTGVLAVVTMLVVVGSGMKKQGVVGFLKAQVPSMDLPYGLGYILIPMIWLIEIFGLFVKHFVLAVRLFANMFAGHLVLAVLVAFIGVTAGTALFWAVMPLSFLGTVAFSLLELFVAFLQAYVFTFLAALFIGSAQHAH